jgi:hypothetical protein
VPTNRGAGLSPVARRLRAEILAWSLASGSPAAAAALTAVVGAKASLHVPLDTWTVASLEQLCGAALVPWLADAGPDVAVDAVARAIVIALRFQIAHGLGTGSDDPGALVAAAAYLGISASAQLRSAR